MGLALHGEDRVGSPLSHVRVLQLRRLFDIDERRMKALVAKDGSDVLEPGHRIAEVGASQPMDGPRRFDRLDGVWRSSPMVSR